ncbi:cytidine deaminase [Riemerella columbipharyngis]|uniref:Cytidine deaminase n=1 Tax=Riemerella columbipharyngis TaxID=1071918 RepID=A0A1G6YF33_9FLAO|nr:cytidine deaminase [Riemerella columbipharyngis]SDD89009.1 cytidine deaminase [Riemerella columbipharyngis]
MNKELRISYKVIEANDLDETEKKLFDAAKKAREDAYAPYSNFLVGCALLLESGEIIKGSNQENAAYPSGLCAERTTIYWASANYPNAKIKKLFVLGAPRDVIEYPPTPPCGACRQSMLEYEAKQEEKIEIYIASLGGAIYKVDSIRSLLPFSFDQSFL